MASTAPNAPKLDRYVVIHVATTCDEHGVYVTKDSAEVIEIGWILLDSKSCDEVCREHLKIQPALTAKYVDSAADLISSSSIVRAFLSSQSTLQSPRCVVSVSGSCWKELHKY
jgi:hypothetical protein